jgi:hypothetical protein
VEKNGVIYFRYGKREVGLHLDATPAQLSSTQLDNLWKKWRDLFLVWKGV